MSRLQLAHAIPAGPKFGSDKRQWSVGQLLAIDTVKNRAQVALDGGPAVWLPYVSNVYTSITTVFVLRDPFGSGSGQLVIGPAGTQSTPYVPPPPPPPAPVSKQVTTVIRPSDSGTWSEKWSRYYAWNVGRYGGSTTLYQGSEGVSQHLDGIAVYGTQLKSLGASSIDAITLHVPLLTGSGTVQVQGTTQSSLGSSFTTPTGATASGTGTISLGATLRDNLRTGVSKGLVLVGGSYLAVAGKASANGMAMTVTYTRTA